MKNQLITILIVAMTLATAWAIRGQFGHEPGAAWAGGIGGLALVLVSKRKDWYTKIFSVAFASAIGWGAGGMMSYGIVVGYGRSSSLPDAFYGLLMLFIIGGLYGILGGGLVGLSLDSTSEKRVNWGCLLSEMVAGGLIGYYLLIVQFEWLMTPPRSEAWALCFGAGMALLWHMARNNFKSPIRVSLFSALGAGFGFAFGNFLQTIGTVMEIQFNMWNVMEYSIGFFGGTGMAYGVFTSVWPVESRVPERWESRLSMMFVFVVIPFLILIKAMGYNTLMERIKDQVNPETTSFLGTLFAGIIIFTVAAIGYYKYLKTKDSFERRDVMVLLIVYFAAYISISYIVSGVFAGRFPLNHQLYWVNFIIILWLTGKQFNPFPGNPKSVMPVNKWLLYLLGIVIIIMFLALISVNTHGVMGGAHERFVN
jgi:hypothetical protein